MLDIIFGRLLTQFKKLVVSSRFKIKSFLQWAIFRDFLERQFSILESIFQSSPCHRQTIQKQATRSILEHRNNLLNNVQYEGKKNFLFLTGKASKNCQGIDELTFKFLHIFCGGKNNDILIDVRPVVIERDEQVVRDVDVAGLNLVDDPLGQVEDRVFIRFDRPDVNVNKQCNVDKSHISDHNKIS